MRKGDPRRANVVTGRSRGSREIGTHFVKITAKLNSRHQCRSGPLSELSRIRTTTLVVDDGSVGHASMIKVKSASPELLRASTAPDSAPPVSESVAFSSEFTGSSSPSRGGTTLESCSLQVRYSAECCGQFGHSAGDGCCTPSSSSHTNLSIDSPCHSSPESISSEINRRS